MKTPNLDPARLWNEYEAPASEYCCRCNSITVHHTRNTYRQVPGVPFACYVVVAQCLECGLESVYPTVCPTV